MDPIDLQTQPSATRLRSLPHPLHLFEALTGSGHFHVGDFEEHDVPLSVALDRLSLRCIPALTGCKTVLDVGCCLGGTTALLQAAGFEATGIDPNRAAIAYARQLAPRARFFACTLAAVPPRAIRVDGIVMIEVLQYFPSLTALFDLCRGRLDDNGVIAILDFTARRELAWHRVPFHTVGRLSHAAERLGFEVSMRKELTESVRPTFEILRSLLHDSRHWIDSQFARHRTSLADEHAELDYQLLQLGTALANGDLTFELVVLRSRG